MSSILPGTTRGPTYAQLFKKGASLRLPGGTSGYVDLVSPAAPTSYSLTLPTALPGVTGYVLSCTDAGVLSWVAQTPATSPAGSGTEIQYRNGSAFGAVAGSSWNATTLTVPNLKLGSAGSYLYDANGDALIRLIDNGSGNTYLAIGKKHPSHVDQAGRNTSIGWEAVAGGSVGFNDCVAVGWRALATGYTTIAIGGSATQSCSTAIGAIVSGAGSIGIAGGSRAGSGVSVSTGDTLHIQWGNPPWSGPFYYICDSTNGIYWGRGKLHATPATVTLNGTGGSGTNVVGGNLVIAPGPSTGNATPSSVVIQSSVATTSGSTAQTLSDTLEITNGHVYIKNSSGLTIFDAFSASTNGYIDFFRPGVALRGGRLTWTGSRIQLENEDATRGIQLRDNEVNIIGNLLRGAINTTAKTTFVVEAGLKTAMSVHGDDIHIRGGQNTTAGDWNGGNAYISGGIPNGAGVIGFVIIQSGGQKTGFNTTAPDRQVEINAADGNCLRLTYNDANGSATYYTDFAVSAAGNLTITPSGTYIEFADAKDLAVGTTTGTKIGTATGQKLGFWNATPVVQQVLATGAGATVDNVISFLQTLGLCKQS